MIRLNKWVKRCVIIFGIAASGYLATTFAHQNRYDQTNEDVFDYFLHNTKQQQLPNGVPIDFRTTKDLIALNGFKYKQYKVKSDDGYILRLHRILTDNPKGPPVMFQHGFIASSDSLIVQNRENALAFLLADAGFDVWLTDMRGDWYSREHVTYKPTEVKFWDFSFHESGYYDLPAFIDKILKVSGQEKLFYIGHSMGTTVFLVMASQRPEYNQKIKAAVLLAPVAIAPTLQELTSGLLRMILIQSDLIYNALNKAGIHEFLPRTASNIKSLRNLCGPSKTQDFCLDILGMSYGENRQNLDRLQIGNQISYLPAGSSLKTAYHISQIYRKGFRMFDYGKAENLKRYNSECPPFYPLQNVTAPVALYYGINDVLINKRGIDELAASLPNLIKNYEVPDPKFSHVDFVFGLNCAKVMNNDIVLLLQSLL